MKIPGAINIVLLAQNTNIRYYSTLFPTILIPRNGRNIPGPSLKRAMRNYSMGYIPKFW